LVDHHNYYMQDSKEKETRQIQIDNINEDIQSIGLTLKGAMHFTKDRGQSR